MGATSPTDCFEKVHLLWDFVEKRSDMYELALDAGEKIKKGESQVRNLVEFLGSWNKARGYDKEILTQRLNFNLLSIISRFESKHDEKEFIKELCDILGDVIAKKGGKHSKKTCEIIGAIKLAHVLYPEVFPLIDNLIAEEVGIKPKGRTLRIDEYIAFKCALDYVINQNTSNFPEKEKYKRIDELLYLEYTWKRDKGESLKRLFKGLGWGNCLELFDDFIRALQEKIEEFHEI